MLVHRIRTNHGVPNRFCILFAFDITKQNTIGNVRFVRMLEGNGDYFGAVSKITLMKIHGGIRGHECSSIVSSFGTTEDGDQYAEYRSIIYCDSCNHLVLYINQ